MGDPLPEAEAKRDADEVRRSTPRPMLLSGRVAGFTELGNSREEALDAQDRCVFAGDANDLAALALTGALTLAACS